MTKTITSAKGVLKMPMSDGGTTNVEKYEFEPIKGYPMLNWRGKRPFNSTQYYPAQLKQIHGEEVDGWRNKIYWGDNLQVMSHLLKQFRGKIDLVYIDPPYRFNKFEKLMKLLEPLTHELTLLLYESDSKQELIEVENYELIRSDVYGHTRVTHYRIKPKQLTD